MPMTGKGLAKLIEECGELLQVAGKKLAWYTNNDHPDGGPPLSERLEDEIADVMAASTLVMELHKLDEARIKERAAHKLVQFREWERLKSNNVYGIDAKPQYCDAGSFRLDEDEEGKFWRGGGPADMDESQCDHGESLILNTDVFPVGTIVSAQEPLRIATMWDPHSRRPYTMFTTQPYPLPNEKQR